MIGAATYEQRPAGTVAERHEDLHVKGKSAGVVAYVLTSVP